MRISVASVLCIALAGLLCLAVLPEHQQVPVIAKAQAQQEPEKPAGATTETPEERIEKTLARPMDLDFDAKPLKEVVEIIQEMAMVPVIIKNKKLEEAATNVETPVTFQVKGISLRSALRLMLGQLGLVYVIEDEVVQITTPEDAGSRLYIRVYDCRELLDLPDAKSGPLKETLNASPSVGEPSGAPLPSAVPNARRKPVLPNDLVGVVQGTVDPDSWEEVGGPGSAREYKGMLVVAQTSETHGKLERLLNLMYSAADLEGKVKVSR